METHETRRSASLNFSNQSNTSRLARLAAKVGLIVLFALLIGAASYWVDVDTTEPVADIVPTITPSIEEGGEITFSLDATVLGSLPAGADSVYFVEYRGYPNYRVLRLDEGVEGFEEVVKIPKGSVIYSMALTSDKSQLLTAYAEQLTGLSNGIYTVDVGSDSAEFVELIPASDNRLFSSIAIASESSFWVTEIDTASGAASYSIAEYDFTGSLLRRVAGAINPVVADGEIYFLPLEDDDSRRSIAKLLPDGTVERIDILDGAYDLDDFLFVDDRIYVAVLERDAEISLSSTSAVNMLLDLFSSTASAHGNHNTPATWVAFDRDDFSYIADADWGAKRLYDSTVLPNGQILELTTEGLEVIDDDRQLIIQSRALRLVTN